MALLDAVEACYITVSLALNFGPTLVFGLGVLVGSWCCCVLLLGMMAMITPRGLLGRLG
jgi:hypothetical protein